MDIKNILRFNKGAAMIYAFGVWTMMGTYGYYSYSGYYDKKPENKTGEEEELDEELPNPNQVVYQGTYMKSTIVYKENFVPYTTRIYNVFKYFSGDSASESPKDTRKNDFDE